MRFGGLALVLVVGTAGCAKQHGEQGSVPANQSDVRNGFRGDAGTFMVPVEAGWALLEGGWPVPFPALPDAGLGSLFDAGPFPGAGRPDSTVPASQLVDPSGACEQPLPLPDTSGTCRDDRWHNPACYRVPSECKALWDRSYCLSLLEDQVHYLGLDNGGSCALRSTRIPRAGDFGSMAQIGADLLLCNDGIVERVALSDGSYDTAPRACSAVFEVNNQLVVHEPISGSLTRYPSWQATLRGQGEVLAFATPGAVFAANQRVMVALWPGSNELAVLAIDGSVTNRVNLSGSASHVTGLELSDDDELFVATPEGVRTYDLGSGAALDFVPIANAHGLVCHPGLRGNPPGRNQAAAPRPGASSDRSDFIVEVKNCAVPLEGPRYVAENGGPELVVLTSHQGGFNRVIDERRTPHILVLSSAEPNIWSVAIHARAQVERIVVSGEQNVTFEVSRGSEMVPVEYLTTRASLGMHDGRVPGQAETMLRSAIESYLERPITELAGCVSNATFTVRDAPLPLCVR